MNSSLRKLLHFRIADDTEDRGDDVHGRVSHPAKRHHEFVGLVEAPGLAVLEDPRNEEGMRLVAHLEDVVLRHEPEAAVRCLQVVESLAHVAVGREDDCLEALRDVGDLHVWKGSMITAA